MICPTCYQKPIENQAGGNTFYYCKTCKEEVFAEESLPDMFESMTPEQKKEMDEWFDMIGTLGDDDVPPPTYNPDDDDDDMYDAFYDFAD